MLLPGLLYMLHPPYDRDGAGGNADYSGHANDHFGDV